MLAEPVTVGGIRTDFSLLIDGEAVTASSSLEVVNPATGRVFARCPAAGRDEIGRAASQSEGLAQIPIEAEILEDSNQRRIELQWHPLGVAGIITPWNAP